MFWPVDPVDHQHAGATSAGHHWSAGRQPPGPFRLAGFAGGMFGQGSGYLKFSTSIASVEVGASCGVQRATATGYVTNHFTTPVRVWGGCFR
jgi:hypothetical protein